MEDGRKYWKPLGPDRYQHPIYVAGTCLGLDVGLRMVVYDERVCPLAWGVVGECTYVFCKVLVILMIL